MYRRFFSASVGLIAIGLLCNPPHLYADGSRPPEPRIVNIYNFCRNVDTRLADSQRVLLDTTAEQIKLVHSHHLTGTWALQYDALMNPNYQSLMKDQLTAQDEVAGWFEIPRALVEKAGLKWRGSGDWDFSSSVDYATGYSPAERLKLVDAYMSDFHSIFGHYPRTMGGWYIDEVTLAYMVDRYGIVASCNCQDRVRVGEDPSKFTTLWGGYWNQAYYPSKLNAYMPAQTKQGQISLPIFRMLGSDPIYQYAKMTAVYAMEPVYPSCGGSTKWVNWYMKSLVEQPSLAFGYVQVGQENSFGWNAMKQGMSYQISLIAEKAKAGEIRVETLEKSGTWFKSHFDVTPPTSVVCLDDWRYQQRKSVWYDSRYYRINLFWNKGGLVIRDLHRFDEKKTSAMHDSPLKSSTLKCETLPVVEAAIWASDGKDASAIPVTVGLDGQRSRIEFDGDPVITQISDSELKIVQPIQGGGSLTILCAETALTCTAVDEQQHPLSWGWELHGETGQSQSVTGFSDSQIQFNFDRFAYFLNLRTGKVNRSSAGLLLLQAADSGELTLQFDK